MFTHPVAEREAVEVLNGPETICDHWAQERLKAAGRCWLTCDGSLMDRRHSHNRSMLSLSFFFLFHSTLTLQTQASYHNDWHFVNVYVCVHVRAWVSLLHARLGSVHLPTEGKVSSFVSALPFKSWMLFINPALRSNQCLCSYPSVSI